MSNLIKIMGVAIFLWVTQANAATDDCFPFVGEKYKFSVGWEFVNAGSAEIRVTKTGINGYKVHNFARTNGFLDLFKRVRDTIISEGVCIDKKMQSTLFTTDQLERKYRATKDVKFLYKENKVSYTKNGKTTMFDVPAGYLNVIDAFYLTRMHPPTKGHPISIPVFDSGEKYELTVKYLKHKMMKTPWDKWVDAIVIQPEMKTEGVFTSVGTIKIWLTNDERHIPLKITAKLKIGRVVVVLEEYSKP